MEAQLGTTNLLLGIMAAVSLLEAIALIGAGIAGWTLYQRVTTLLDELESKHVQPVMSRVNVILDDVRDVTSRVKEETNRVNHAIHSTIDRVDDTADRMRSNVRAKTSRVVGFVRGVRVAIETMLRPAA
jgi:phage-related protein